MPIVESGVTLTFPDSNFFRFQDCEGYKNIQQNFKEMDVCWYDQTSDTLYVIELKDWGNGRLLEESDPTKTAHDIRELKGRITEHRVKELLKKSVDSASMFISVLLNRTYSANLTQCFPFTITLNTAIRFLSVINWASTDVTYVSNVHSSYKAYFSPYAKLFGIKSFVVMTKDQAVQRFPWIA